MRRFDDHLLLSPSDLNDLLECRHLMALEIARFRGEPVPERTRGAHTEILVRYGEEHEARVLAELEAEGVPVVRIETGAGQGRLREAVEQTRAAMVDGARVIHQAALVAGGVGGYADFLERVDRPSRLGEWSYEVADAKLARTTKPYFLVQLSAYAAMLEELQGLAPEDVIVLLGDGSRDTYRTADFAAYVRALHDRADKLVNVGAADENVRHVVVQVLVRVAHVGAVQHQRVIEQRAVAVRNRRAASRRNTPASTRDSG